MGKQDDVFMSSEMFSWKWVPKHYKTVTLYPSLSPQIKLYIKASRSPPLFFLCKSLSVARMKKINLILRKCKTLSKQLGRTSSYSSLNSNPTREETWVGGKQKDEHWETIFVGSSRRRYAISSRYLNHPLINALIEKSKQKPGEDILVKCEVVLFDHILWMLENTDPSLASDSLEELAELYMF